MLRVKWIVALALLGAVAAAAEVAVAGKTPKGSKSEKEKTMSAKAAKAPRKAGPRKVIVGTSMYAMWGEYPGLEKRLEQLGSLVDDMAGKAKEKYGRSIDIAALPEIGVSGGLPFGPDAAFPIEGRVGDYFAAKCREYNTYIVVPMFLKEKNKETGREERYNACVLLDRQGKVAGIYRKVHAVADGNNKTLEGGCLPGRNFPVFECDFGKVAIQICYDMSYDDGWEVLGRKGAELVVWSSQSPGQIKAAFRAMRNNYYVVTSTWRNNASLFDPTGAMIRCITDPKSRVLVEEIDLDYLLIPWQRKLQNGKAFDKKFAKGSFGYRYSEAEDGGIFWSNDPAKPIKAMAEELGLFWGDQDIERARKVQDKVRGGPPSLD
ncbi:MAG: hypothetical protein GWP05_08830 [Anaerolineaceae bacterium]|nr:hypothetical protein [Anaerolineaceae bacterium]